MKGTIQTGGSETPIELFTKAPNKRMSISQRPSYTAFDGTRVGWAVPGVRRARCRPSESDGGSIDAEFSLALRMKEIFPQLRRGRPETISGVECEVLNGTRPGQASGAHVLRQELRAAGAADALRGDAGGPQPTQIDYADYREMDGVKSPLRWTLSRPNGRFTIQVKEAKNNVPIEDAKFVRPSGDIQVSDIQAALF